jgi:deazaflavin-dependent oxidoreductase (nitroreductase family)
MPEKKDRNAPIIEEFRANEGKVGGYFAGRPMLILHTKGRKTGLPRANPLVYPADGDRFVIIASKGGAPNDPQWYRNLSRNRTSRSRSTPARSPSRRS